MKKLILSVAAMGAMSIPAFAQGVAFEDNSGAAYDTTIAGVPNTTQDLNLELLTGSSSSSVTTPVVTLLLSSGATPATGAFGQIGSASGDISGAGSIYDLSGAEYLFPSASYGNTAYFEVEAWTGNYSSYAAAEASATSGVFAGTSSIFNVSVPTTSNANPVDVSGVGIINLTQVPISVVPEPSSIAMTGIGLASMLIFRRKNK